jgi:hypothetical protein
MRSVAAKMGEESEGPFAAGLEAVARLALGEPDGAVELDRAVEALRALDSRWMVACVLVLAAEVDASAGRPEVARTRASQALDVARDIGRRSEAARASTLLARLDLEAGARDAAVGRLRPCLVDLAAPWALTAHARSVLGAAAQAIGLEIPTPVQTLPTTPRA